MKSADRLLPLLLCAAIFGAFLPVLTHTYGRLDDMAFAHWFARDFSSTMRDIFIAQGRPLHGLLLAVLLHPVATFGDLVWLRLFGLMLTCAFALQVFFFLRREAFGDWASWWLSLAVVAQPGLAAIVGWGICSTHVIGFMGAFAIGNLALRSGELDAAKSTLTWKTFLRTAALLIPVLCLYQPAAAFVLLPALFAWFLRSERPLHPKHMIALLVAYFAALGIYFIGLKLVVDVWLSLNTQSERSALVSDIPGKLLFLFREPLSLIGLSWAFFLPSFARAAMWAFVSALLGGAMVMGLRQEPRRVLWGLLWTGLFLSSGLVHLVVLEANYAPFRVLTFGYIIATFLLGWIIRQWIVHDRAWVGRSSRLLLAGAATLAAFATHHHILRGIAQPYEREYLHYRHVFESELVSGQPLPMTILWVVPDHFDMRSSIRLRRLRFEFGTLSSGMEYVLPGMSWMLLNEIRNVRSPQHPMWEAHLAVDTVPLRRDRMWSRPPGLPFIDGPAIFGHPASKPAETMTHRQTHPLIGEVESLYHGWNYSPWFGIFNRWVYPGVQHSVLGRVKIQQLQDGRLSMDLPTYGVVFTTPDSFPEAICPLSGESITLGSANRFPAKR